MSSQASADAENTPGKSIFAALEVIIHLSVVFLALAALSDDRLLLCYLALHIDADIEDCHKTRSSARRTEEGKHGKSKI